MIKIFLPILALLAVMILLLNKPAAPIPRSFETKQNTEANVKISVTPQTLAPGKQATFQISFTTHSVDLNFDVSGIAALVDEKNNSLGKAVWEGTPPGGHHRSGTLTFPDPLPKKTKAMTLTLINISGIATRTFNWEVVIQ